MREAEREKQRLEEEAEKERKRIEREEREKREEEEYQKVFILLRTNHTLPVGSAVLKHRLKCRFALRR